MKTTVFTLLGSLALLTSACSSLPENARKLDLNINSVTFENVNNVEGFKIDYDVRHHSSEPMPIDAVKIDVHVNDKLAAVYKNDSCKPIPNKISNNYSIFIPANKASKVALESLKNTPMLQVQAKAIVSILVEKDLEDRAAMYNVTKKYEGVIHATTAAN